MELKIKKSMKAFWSTKDWSQKPTSFLLDQFSLEAGYPTDAPPCSIFQQTEGDGRKLKKVQELAQYFREQCRHLCTKTKYIYIYIYIITTNESLRSVNYEGKKRKGKKKNCSLYKSETNLFQMFCGLMWYLGKCWGKLPHSLELFLAIGLISTLRGTMLFLSTKK